MCGFSGQENPGANSCFISQGAVTLGRSRDVTERLVSHLHCKDTLQLIEWIKSRSFREPGSCTLADG